LTGFKKGTKSKFINFIKGNSETSAKKEVKTSTTLHLAVQFPVLSQLTQNSNETVKYKQKETTL